MPNSELDQQQRLPRDRFDMATEFEAMLRDLRLVH